MMLAPLKTNLMAPLSTCWCGRMKGSMKDERNVLSVWVNSNALINKLTLGELTFMQQSEGWVEWSFSLSEEKQLSIHCQDFNVFMAGGGTKRQTSINIHYTKRHCVWKHWWGKWNDNSYHLTIFTGSFFGIMWLSHDSMSGNCSNSWFLMPLITDVFSWIQFDTFSFSSNLK